MERTPATAYDAAKKTLQDYKNEERLAVLIRLYIRGTSPVECIDDLMEDYGYAPDENGNYVVDWAKDS